MNFPLIDNHKTRFSSLDMHVFIRYHFLLSLIEKEKKEKGDSSKKNLQTTNAVNIGFGRDLFLIEQHDIEYQIILFVLLFFLFRIELMLCIAV